MTKLQAINEIRDQDRATRTSKAALKRLRQAMRVLGLSSAEQITLECAFDYRGCDGKPYPAFQEK